MKEPALVATFSYEALPAAALKARMALRSKLHKRQRESTVTTYCKAVNYFLGTYASDDKSPKQRLI